MQRSESPQAPAGAPRRRTAALATAAAGLVLGASLAACSSSFASRSPGPATGPDARPSAAAPPGGGQYSPGHPGNHSKPRVNTDGNRISGLITFTGTFHVTGSRSAHVSFRAFPGVTRPSSSCSALAAHGTPVASGQQPQFRIPAPPGGSSAYFIASVGSYHGPGGYGKDQILSVGQNIVVGTASYGLGSPLATASATIRPDGSGSFRFTHAKAGSSGRTVSGTVTWKCSG